MKQDREDRQASMIPTLMANVTPGHLAKPGELIDFRIDGLDKLTKVDLDIENRLLRNALDNRDRVRAGELSYTIPMRALNGGRKDNERVFASLTRLQKTIMQVRTGKDGILSVPKLAEFTHGEANGISRGMLNYEYTPRYLRVMHFSMNWGLLDVDLMSRLPSKYAYRLFEVVARRIKLRHMTTEAFSPGDMRDIVLGVPKGKLQSSNDLWRYAIAPAIAHVNEIAPFEVDIEPVVEKRIVTGYVVRWTGDAAVIDA